MYHLPVLELVLKPTSPPPLSRLPHYTIYAISLPPSHPNILRTSLPRTSRGAAIMYVPAVLVHWRPGAPFSKAPVTFLA